MVNLSHVASKHRGKHFLIRLLVNGCVHADMGDYSNFKYGFLKSTSIINVSLRRRDYLVVLFQVNRVIYCL